MNNPIDAEALDEAFAKSSNVWDVHARSRAAELIARYLEAIRALSPAVGMGEAIPRELFHNTDMTLSDGVMTIVFQDDEPAQALFKALSEDSALLAPIHARDEDRKSDDLLEQDALISAEVAYTATGGSVNTKLMRSAIAAYLSASPALKRLASAWHEAGGHPTEDLMIAVRDAAALSALSKREARSNTKREETDEEAHERMMRGDLR